MYFSVSVLLKWGNIMKVRVKVKVAQSCPTLSTPWIIVHRILQDRILEWVAFPSPGDLPDPGIEPRSPTLTAFFFLNHLSHQGSRHFL